MVAASGGEVMRILVCGGNGFLGQHLVKRLFKEGHYVRAVGRGQPSDYLRVNEYVRADLCEPYAVERAFEGNAFDEVYQLASEGGGLGHIMDHSNDRVLLTNSLRINLNVLEAARKTGAGRIFFASSACVYPSLKIYGPGFGACREEDAYPAQPDNEFAWEKLISERIYLAYGREQDMQVRIARFHNFYGPGARWRGGREKVIAALCRKIAELPPEGGEIEVWGDGTAVRSFTYIDDIVEGTLRLMRSDFAGPVNIGSSEMVNISDLVSMLIVLSGRKISVEYVKGPVGVQARNSDNTLIRAKLGWEPTIPLIEGLARTYE